MMTDNELLKKLFFLSKEIVEENCYTFDEGMKHAYCRSCKAVTGAGAIYRHQPECKIAHFGKLLDTISPRI